MSGLHGNKVVQPYLQEEAWRAQAGMVAGVYDSDEMSLGIVTDQSLKNRIGSKLFKKVPVAHRLVIRSNQDISIKLNATTNDPITIDGGIFFDLHWLELVDVFVTTVAVVNPIRIILA